MTTLMLTLPPRTLLLLAGVVFPMGRVHTHFTPGRILAVGLLFNTIR